MNHRPEYPSQIATIKVPISGGLTSNKPRTMVPIVRDSRKNIFERFVEQQAEKALLDTPADLIVGPRRAGKTTLVRKIGEASRTYITLNDQTSIFLAPERCTLCIWKLRTNFVRNTLDLVRLSLGEIK